MPRQSSRVFYTLHRCVDKDVVGLYNKVIAHPKLPCISRTALFMDIYYSLSPTLGTRNRKKSTLYEMLDVLDVIQHGKTGERS